MSICWNSIGIILKYFKQNEAKLHCRNIGIYLSLSVRKKVNLKRTKKGVNKIFITWCLYFKNFKNYSIVHDRIYYSNESLIKNNSTREIAKLTNLTKKMQQMWGNCLLFHKLLFIQNVKWNSKFKQKMKIFSPYRT